MDKLPFWIRNHILKYYICNLKPSDLILLYASGFTHILEALSWQEWTQIYRNDHRLIREGSSGNLVLKSSELSCNSYYGNKDSIPALPEGLHYVSFSSGEYHSLAITSDGQIVAWGDDEYGQCTNIPVLPKGTRYLAVSAGYYHSLALRSDGQIVAWGNDSNGQCTNIPILPDLPKGTLYTSIAAGGYHNLILRSDGKIFAWGYDLYGQCTHIPATTNDLRITSIAAGGFHSLAIRSDGKVISWGVGDFLDGFYP